MPSTSEPIRLDTLRLGCGSHGRVFTGACCLVEAANLVASGVVVTDTPPPCPLEPHRFTDDHPSISRVVRAFAIALNDAWDDEARQQLLPYAPRLLCTATGDEDERTRAWLATDWLVRVNAPAFLRLAGLAEHAQALESLARIVDGTTARDALPSIAAARLAAHAAELGSSGLVSDAGWFALWTQAGGPAAEACELAWEHDVDDADAEYEARSDSTWAARYAAWAAGSDVLRPAVALMQASALGLLDSMLRVGR